jgi:Uma2 family endonuclease
VSSHPKTFLTPEEYLAIERKAAYKSEYYQGEMFAMAGAQENHNRLAAHLMIYIGQHIVPRGCSLYGSDMRVLVSPVGLYTYPDLSALCGEPQLLDSEIDTLLNPALIVEVLSPSTEAYDRGWKFQQYRSVDSLREYLLVASTTIAVDCLTRQPDGQWLLRSSNRLEDTFELQSVGCQFRLADIYQRVKFPDVGKRDRPGPVTGR